MKVEIGLSEGVEAIVEEGLVKFSKGGKHCSKTLDHPFVKIRLENGKIVLEGVGDSKNVKKIINTYAAHIKNLLRGLDEEFVYKLKICSSHFPMDVQVKEDQVIIKNFIGERKPRFAKIMPDTTVKVVGDEIIVSSVNKEFAGQTAANIERATRLSKRDRRKFQDGIYITVKAGKEI